MTRKASSFSAVAAACGIALGQPVPTVSVLSTTALTSLIVTPSIWISAGASEPDEDETDRDEEDEDLDEDLEDDETFDDESDEETDDVDVDDDVEDSDVDTDIDIDDDLDESDDDTDIDDGVDDDMDIDDDVDDDLDETDTDDDFDESDDDETDDANDDDIGDDDGDDTDTDDLDDIDISLDRDDQGDGDDDDEDEGEEDEDEDDESGEDDDEEGDEDDEDDEFEDDEFDEIAARERIYDDEGYPARRAEILAFDMAADELEIAEELGFRLLERRTLSSIDGTIDRISVPARFASPQQAIDALDQSIPAAPFDYNHIYSLPDGSLTVTARDDSLGADFPLSGRGVRIGVIDTLPDPDHPSFANQSIVIRDFAGQGGRDHAHATAIVSILVGTDPESRYRGLIPGAEVFAANIFQTDRHGRPSTDAFKMIEALDWLAEQDVGVINMSIAGPPSDVLREMLDRLAARGHIVVAAVGNDGPAAPPLFPAAYEGVLGVTAVDLNGRIYRRAGRGDHVDYAAPGVGLRAAAAGGHYGEFTGTSFAAPIVSALLAVDLKARSHETRNAILSVPQEVRDLGQPGRDDVFGHGAIQARGETP